MKIGIIGGSFDPIHFGHLIMAEYIREYKDLEKVIFVPTGTAPHKKYSTTSDVRMKMVDMAITNNDYFASSNIEISSENVSYTIDTLKYLRNICPDPEFYFIIGLDNLFNIETWKNFEELSTVTKFIVANRIGYDKGDSSIQEKFDELTSKYGYDIEIIDTPIVEISSSDIRNRISEGKSIKYLTPQKIEEYIIENEFYQPEESE